MRWAVHATRLRVRERKSTYTYAVGKCEETRPPGRPMRKYKDNIKINFQKIRWPGLDSVSGEFLHQLRNY